MAKNITSKAVQTKVAKSIESELSAKFKIFNVAELMADRFIRGDYQVIEVFEKGLPFITSAVIETIQEVVNQYSGKYDNVWYDMACKPESYFDSLNDLQWRYIPCVEIHVGRRAVI